MRYLVNFVAVAALWDVVAGNVFDRLKTMKMERHERLHNHFKRSAEAASQEHVLEKRATRYLNSKTQPFAVNGTSLPDVNFDVGESYAGVLPISDDADETRKLYFWFFPSADQLVHKEIVIWLQGGPGGASTGGLLLENGPMLWQPGTAKPTKNNFAWNNFTNVVWIDQPVGTGFSVGKPNVTNEYEAAEQFMGFFKNFVKLFSMQGYAVYITGESYGGYYVPYFANAFLDANDTSYYNYKGSAINDPIIGNAVLQFEAVAMQYLNTWAPVFALNSSTMAALTAQNQRCGYVAYLDKYFRFPPPKAPFPGVFGNGNFSTNVRPGCDIQADILNAVAEVNPCFNFDHIFDTCPVLSSPFGESLSSQYTPPGPKTYYNRADVRKAIHAPAGVVWHIESNRNPFVGDVFPYEVAFGDASFPPADIGIVSRIIEATNNIIVGVGGLDFQLPANGTLFVFQNMTWNGAQGFSSYPSQPLIVPPKSFPPSNSFSGQGQLGIWGAERGLTFYVSTLAGHEGPWYTPGVAYRVLQTLLGRVPNLSSTSDF